MSIHTCSYYCDRPDCIRAQRDELRQKLEQEKPLPEDWYGQAQWQFGYERGWDKATEKREWVSLTFTEYMEAIKGKEDIEDCWHSLEAKLKEKNT
jgi:hypothetical protein